MANRVATYLDFATARTGELYRSACLLTGGDTHLAEDLVQETLERVFVRWRLVSGADNPAAYVQTMLVRTSLSWRRRRSSSERPTGELPEASVVEHGDAALRVTLMGALAQLSPRDRAVLVLRYWEDRSIEQTAAVLNLTPGAVSTRCSRALTRLRSQLGDGVSPFAGR